MGLFDGKDVKPATAKAEEPKVAQTAPTATAQTAETAVAPDATADDEDTPTKRKIKMAALEKICKYCQDNKVPAEILDACKLVRPSFFGLGGGGGFQKAEFRAWQTKLMQVLGVKTFEEIKVGATFDEMKVFMTLHAGRKEMKQITKDLIKKPGEKSAVWVSFDADKGIYKVEGVGAQPANWTGYVPTANDAE